MKKLLNILLVRRPETENKWWHRLVNVVIFSTTVLVLIIGFFISFNSFKHNKQNSFENPIKQTNLTLEEIQQADKVSGWKSTAELADGSYIINGEPSSRSDVIRYIGSESQKADAKLKIVNKQELAKNLFWAIIISIGWFIFWESIIYRTLLYIIFGKKK